MKFKKPTALILIISIFCFINVTKAQSKVVGEIINVNQDYRIAFSDLNNSQLNVGEVVEIYKEDKFLTYLEVFESSNVISKLMPIETGTRFKTEVTFDKINVGNRVVKIASGKNIQDSNEPFADVQLTKNNKYKEISDKYDALSVRYTEIFSENRRLGLENKELEKKLNKGYHKRNSSVKGNKEIKKLKNVISKLKVKLNNMEKLLEGNGK